LQNIKENELVEILKPPGLQNKQAKDFKVAIGEIADKFRGKIPGTKKEIQMIHGISQKISLLILEEVFKIVGVSSAGTVSSF